MYIFLAYVVVNVILLLILVVLKRGFTAVRSYADELPGEVEMPRGTREKIRELEEKLARFLNIFKIEFSGVIIMGFIAERFLAEQSGNIDIAIFIASSLFHASVVKYFSRKYNTIAND